MPVDESLAENRWMPPSPHREAVLKVIREGRAFVEERGHNQAPVLVFEDGGVMELPKVRYQQTHRGMELVVVDDAAVRGQTRHRDVCGSIDEFKGLLEDEPEIARSRPEALRQLLDDACYMLSRMERRTDHYEQFATDVAGLCRRMSEVTRPVAEGAHQSAEDLRAVVQDAPETMPARREELFAMAEAIRDAANQLEATLSAHLEAAVEIGKRFEQLKGGRTWPAPGDPA